MKFVQAMGLMVLIALGMPAPKLTTRWVKAIRASDALGEQAGALERRGVRLETLPVVPLEELRAGTDGVVCDEVLRERSYLPVCLGEDAVYLSETPTP